MVLMVEVCLIYFDGQPLIFDIMSSMLG